MRSSHLENHSKSFRISLRETDMNDISEETDMNDVPEETDMNDVPEEVAKELSVLT